MVRLFDKDIVTLYSFHFRFNFRFIVNSSPTTKVTSDIEGDKNKDECLFKMDF
jgi:hypothetical protein